MNVLITAGNTQIPIDRVRCLTNIFTGRTGAQIALCAQQRGHKVTLCTSHPRVVEDLSPEVNRENSLEIRPYRTFEELDDLMAAALRPRSVDALIHSAAVSDYLAGGVYSPATGTQFIPQTGQWHGSEHASPTMVDRAAGKVKSDEDELWLRLVRAPKLVDKVRNEWGFQGVLVKFKLEVGVSEERLLEIAERSRRHSAADLMVANTLEGSADWAVLGPIDGAYRHIVRSELADRLMDEVERLTRSRTHG